MTPFFKIDKRIEEASDRALEKCKEQFASIENIAEYNQLKVQKAFIEYGVSEKQLVSKKRYAYGDRGLDTLDKV